MTAELLEAARAAVRTVLSSGPVQPDGSAMLESTDAVIGALTELQGAEGPAAAEAVAALLR